MKPSVLVTHEECLQHVTPPGHPEQVARLEYILEALKDINLSRVSAPMAAEDDILRIHPREHINYLQDVVPETGFKSIDGDTHISSGSLTAAYRAAGGVLRAVDLVLSGEAKNAFVAVRPPGHHAENSKAMGFCIFGNVAIAAKYAIKIHGLNRVAVVDFDVHHGNGTQDLLWDEPRTLFCSMHQSPLWPGSGQKDETGGFNNIINIPVDPETDGEKIRIIFNNSILPKLESFRPELLIISAGFDAHADDPLANLNLVEEDYAWITHKLCDVAEKYCNGRLVSSLEGGYNLEALAASVAAHVNVLMERSK